MAEFRLWSDLHLEFQNHNFDLILKHDPKNRDQILILAGDIDTGISSQDAIEKLCEEFKHVIRVPGNHEFYNNDIDKLLRYWADYELSAPKNFHFLYNQSRVIDGVKIIGGTMWTGLNNADPITQTHVYRYMNDYGCITMAGRELTTTDVISEHKKFVEFLLDELKDTSLPTLVITHHSPGSVYRADRSDRQLAHAYYADLEQLIGNSQISMWVHGHTHESQDYFIGETRIVCNPYGYHAYHTNKNFDSNLVLTIA